MAEKLILTEAATELGAGAPWFAGVWAPAEASAGGLTEAELDPGVSVAAGVAPLVPEELPAEPPDGVGDAPITCVAVEP